MRCDVRLSSESFAPHDLSRRFASEHAGLGGLCSFTGYVRGEDAAVEALELIHYEPLTLPGMERLAGCAIVRFELSGILIVHRVGAMLPGEPIVLVCAAAHHRRGAIDAVDFAMDHLKSDSWFWKREKRNGGWRWIEPRAQDHHDLSRWKG